MPGRIFHLEDGHAYARELHGRLRELGHDVVIHVHTVAEAMALVPDELAKQSINLAILDRDLPDGSGALVAKAIRASALGFPIIANSGYETDWGDYNITKLHRRQLLATVKELLSS